MNILVDVNNQKLRVATNLKNLVSGTQEFVKFTFNLGEDWDGLTVFAQFQQRGNAYNQYLDANDSVFLPAEIEHGQCLLVLYGTGGTVKATTNYLTLTIDENILVSNAESTDISQSLYDQLIDEFRRLGEQFEQMLAMSNSGEININSVDTEVRDARKGDNGIIYPTLGKAVRGQFREMKNAVATDAEFLSEMGGDFSSDDTLQEAISDLNDIIDDARDFEDRIDELESEIKLSGKNSLVVECLGDSFIDYRAEGLCHNCQGFAADDNYFYIYRAGRIWYDGNQQVKTDKACGHLQKIDRETLATVGEKDYAPTVSNGVLTDCGLEHGNDMTVVTINNHNYLFVVAGNNLANTESTNKAWLIDTTDLSTVSSFTLSVTEDGSQVNIYKVAAIKGTNEIYLAHSQRLYKTKVTLSGSTASFSALNEIPNVLIRGNQGIDYEGGFVYSIDARTRAIDVINLEEGTQKFVKIDYIMQGYILAEPEGIVVIDDDVYLSGGSNANDFTGISQTMICHGNFAAQVRSFSMKANIRNLDTPIALFAGQESIVVNALPTISSSTPSCMTSEYVDYYVQKTVNSQTKYDLYRWHEKDNNDETDVSEYRLVSENLDKTVNYNDSGSYEFAYHIGYRTSPYSSIYTAFLAAKSLYLLGLGSSFNIHVNSKITRNIHLYGQGFSVSLTSDIQGLKDGEDNYPYAAENEYAAGEPLVINLHNVDGSISVSADKLVVDAGRINCNGSFPEIVARNGAVVTTNSPRDFTSFDTNGVIFGKNKIFSRNGIYEMANMYADVSHKQTSDLYKIFRRVGVIGDSLAVGHMITNPYRSSGSAVRASRNIEYSWPKVIGRDANAEWSIFGTSGQTTIDWLGSTSGYGKAELEATGNKCQAYIIGIGENDLADSGNGTVVPLGTISDISQNNETPSKFYEAYYRIIEVILAVNPDAKIFCLTNPVGAGEKRAGFNQAVKDIVALWDSVNILVVDLHKKHGALFEQANSFLKQDSNTMGDHYSAIGYNIIAKIIEEAISDTIKDNSGAFYNVRAISYDEPIKVGDCRYDSTLNKPTWWDGTQWRDAIGTIVSSES